jgi:hypothetical protein
VTLLVSVTPLPPSVLLLVVLLLGMSRPHPLAPPLDRGREELRYELIKSHLFLTGKHIQPAEKSLRDTHLEPIRVSLGMKRLGRVAPTLGVLQMSIEAMLQLLDNLLSIVTGHPNLGDLKYGPGEIARVLVVINLKGVLVRRQRTRTSALPRLIGVVRIARVPIVLVAIAVVATVTAFKSFSARSLTASIRLITVPVAVVIPMVTVVIVVQIAIVIVEIFTIFASPITLAGFFAG